MNGAWIGYLAGFVTTLCYLPQLGKILRTKKTSDISVNSYLLLGSGLALWCVFGFITENWPVLIANSVSCCFVLAVLTLKRIYPH